MGRNVKINERGLQALKAEQGKRLQDAVNQVARETVGRSIDEAAQVMHRRLTGMGYPLPAQACRDGIEKMRAGQRWEIQMG